MMIKMDFNICGFTLLSFLLMVVDYTRAVIITNLHVPFSATHEASLDCKYDLEGDQLYDVKWYKDGQHFFRCQPNGQVQEFQLDGIKIYPTNFATIGSCPLTLIGLNFKSGGEYKCEVTTEGPSFKAIAKSAKMKILQLSRRVQEPTVEKTNESTDNLINSLSNASKTSSPTTSIRKGFSAIMLNLFVYLPIVILTIYY